MNILITNLHKDASAVRQQFFCNNQTVAQICEVGVYAEGPRIAVRLNLLPFAG